MKVSSARLAAVLAFLLVPLCAHAAHVSLGGNLSFVQLSQSASGVSEKSTTLQIPSETPLGITPGLRIGFVGERGMDDVYLDLGYVGIENEHFGTVTLNYQRNLTHATTAPYLTLGAGLFESSFDGNADSHAMGGGGFGVVHRLTRQQGALRAEVRMDALDESPETAALISVGLKAGFDLYLH